MARPERDGFYWDLKTNTPFYGWGNAGRLETTGLAISALAAWRDRHPEAKDAEAAIRRGVIFLLRGRDRFGSWQSTQSTVRAMKAMADAAPILGNFGKGAGSLDVVANGRVVKILQMPNDPHAVEPILIDVSSFLQPGENRLELLPATGVQSAMAHLSSSYWIPWQKTNPDPSPELRLSVQFDHLEAGVGDSIECAVKAERVGFHGYGMMLAEVGLPPEPKSIAPPSNLSSTIFHSV